MEGMFEFNLDEVEESRGGVVPAGSYLAQVEESEFVDTKSGGKMIKVMFNIVGEQQNGRKLFEQYNVVNKNPEAAKIGLGQIKSLVLASGASISMFKTPEQLIGLECVVKVKVYESEGYGEQNSITSYKKLGGESPVNKTAGQELPKGSDGKPIF